MLRALDVLVERDRMVFLFLSVAPPPPPPPPPGNRCRMPHTRECRYQNPINVKKTSLQSRPHTAILPIILPTYSSFQVSRAVALKGVVAAPGVVRGAHERCWWAYHPDAVRSTIVGVGPEGSEEEAQVDEVRDFFTRYL